MNTNTEIITNPRGNREAAMATVQNIQNQEADILAIIRATEVTEENYKSEQITSTLTGLKSAIEDIRDRGKKLVAKIAEETEAMRVLSQIDSRLWSYSTKADQLCTYAKLTAAYNELKAKVDAFKAAHTPPAPKHTYVIQLQTTDKGLKDIIKVLEKVAPGEYRYDAPQSDKQFKAIDKWFEANV